MIDDLEKILPLGPGVKLIKYDPETSLIALDKPVGVKSHPNHGRPEKDSLLVAPYKMTQKCYHLMIVSPDTIIKRYYTDPTSSSLKVYLLNRLDSPTSGIILLALDPKVVKRVKELFRAQKVKKIYQAQVKGHPTNETWIDTLKVTKKGDKLRTQQARGGDLAKTSIKLINYDKKTNISEVELTPHTGRTHQLRVQCALHGHPILGDKTYGDFSFNKEHKPSRMYLHSSEMQILGDVDFKVKSSIKFDNS